MIWSGEECGFNQCTYGDIIDLSKSKDEEVLKTATIIEDISHAIGTPQKKVKLDQYTLNSTSYCGLEY